MCTHVHVCVYNPFMSYPSFFSPPKDVYYDYQQAEADRQKDDSVKSRPSNSE